MERPCCCRRCRPERGWRGAGGATGPRHDDEWHSGRQRLVGRGAARPRHDDERNGYHERRGQKLALTYNNGKRAVGFPLVSHGGLAPEAAIGNQRMGIDRPCFAENRPAEWQRWVKGRTARLLCLRLIFDRCVAAIAEWFVPRCATSANGHTVADFVLITVR